MATMNNLKLTFLRVIFLILIVNLTSCSNSIEKEAKEICDCGEQAKRENNTELMKKCRAMFVIYEDKHGHDKAAMKKLDEICGVH